MPDFTLSPEIKKQPCQRLQSIRATRDHPMKGDATVVATSSDGIKLASVARGSGPPLLALHGGPANDRSGFGDWLDPIAEYRTLYLLDQRGCGASDDAGPETYTLTRLAEDVDDVRRSIAQEKIDILAHSLGGLIGVTYATLHPDRVGALILVSSPIRGWRGAIANPSSWPLWGRTVLSEIRKDTDWTEFHLKHELGNALRREDVRGLLSVPRRYDPVRVQRLGISLGVRPLDVAPAIRAGVAVVGIYGRQDRRFLGDASYLASAGVRVEYLDQCGHHPFVEQHEAFHRIVAGMLGSVREQRAKHDLRDDSPGID